MTRYVVWRPDWEQTIEDGKVFDAYSPANACEQWAERDDADSADYLIIRGNDVELLVAELGSSLPPCRYSVSGEAVPSYRATMARAQL